jgi:crotonobetainyl-CoA:carnitine CoA-transferase CaiB-like acyl-CoA transferase
MQRAPRNTTMSPSAASDPPMLDGIKVLDLSTVVSGPMCTQILGDLGADVIKIETPTGDITRMMGPPFIEGLTPIFAQVNRNKRGVVLDLKKPGAVEIVRRMARDADVVVENFRPGVADRLGIGYDVLASDNERLVYVAISGFGPTGPYVEQPAYDNVIQGLTGFTHVQGGSERPELVRCIVADKASALTAAYAVMGALFARERTGAGRRVDVPMLDAYAAFMLPDVLGERTFPDHENTAPAMNMAEVHRAWKTADGHVVMMVIQDDQFAGLCRILEREDLIADERAANLITRIMHAEALFGIIAEELAKRSTAEIVERARQHRVPVAPANNLEAFIRDPQVVANSTLTEVDDPAAGRMRLLRNPLREASPPAPLRHRPPRHGEHSDEILAEHGYGPEEVAALRETGAVR